MVLSLTSDDYTVNPAFNGNGMNNMLAVGNLLNVNDKGAILLTIRIPACATTMFTNTATLTGTNPVGGTVTDVSQNGADPDPDADGNPNNNGVGTPVNTTSVSLLGLAKRTVQTINNSDGSADVTFEFNIENFGTTNLTNIQVVENLAAAFAPCGVPTVLSLTSDDYTVNPAFNGNGTNNMLAAGNLLNVNDKGAILLTIRIPACATTMFTNTATLTGTNPVGGTVTDVSQNGADPDPDGDNNPNNNGVGTPVNTTSVSLLGLAKRTVQTINNSDGSADVTFEFNIENFGTTNLTNIQVVENLAAAFAPCGVPTVLSLTSDDYTVNPAFNGNGTNNMLASGQPVERQRQRSDPVDDPDSGLCDDFVHQYRYADGYQPDGWHGNGRITKRCRPRPGCRWQPGQQRRGHAGEHDEHKPAWPCQAHGTNHQQQRWKYRCDLRVQHRELRDNEPDEHPGGRKPGGSVCAMWCANGIEPDLGRLHGEPGL